MTNMTEEEEKALEEAALLAVADFGAAENAWHPDYGQIIKDGKLTEAGIQLMKDHEAY
jgi:hypothetical protein